MHVVEVDLGLLLADLFEDGLVSASVDGRYHSKGVTLIPGSVRHLDEKTRTVLEGPFVRGVYRLNVLMNSYGQISPYYRSSRHCFFLLFHERRPFPLIVVISKLRKVEERTYHPQTDR